MTLTNIARKALELRSKATQCEMFATDAEYGRGEVDGALQEWTEDRATWTVSRHPEAPGWNTDGGYPGYGIDKADAEFFAFAANNMAALAEAYLKLTKGLHE